MARAGSEDDAMTMKMLCVAALALSLTGCEDREQEALVTGRCEALLAAQEMAGLPAALRIDPRATIRPKGDARVQPGERIVFARRAYDRLAPEGTGSRIEPREYSCKFDRKTDKVVMLSTNGHTLEMRDSDEEWAIKQKGALSRQAGKPD